MGHLIAWHVKEIVEKNTNDGFYDSELLGSYDDDEWERINSFVKHERDFNISYVGMEQFAWQVSCTKSCY